MIFIKIKAETLPSILAVFGCLVIIMGLLSNNLIEVIVGFFIILIALKSHLPGSISRKLSITEKNDLKR